MTPILSTARLTLRPLTKASQRQIDWLRDPEVVRYSEQRHLNHTLSTQLRYIQSFSLNSHLWGIHLVETGEHIGNLSAQNDEPNSVADVGILIGNKSQWRKGYASEAWKAACDWLIDKECGAVRKLQCGMMKCNEAMVLIARNSKFTFEAEQSNRFLLDGNPISALFFGRVR